MTGRGGAWAFVLVPLATAAAVAAVLAPGLVVVTALALVAVASVVAKPWLAIAYVLAVEGLGLAFIVTGTDTGVLAYASFGLAALAACATRGTARQSSRRPLKAWALGCAFAIILGGAVAFVAGMPIGQTAAGARLLATPILCALIAAHIDRRQIGHLLRTGTGLLVLSAVASVVELRLGVTSLQDAGLTYGINIRHFGDDLRAPGLFATNYALGAFAGVLGALAICWWPALRGGKADRGWRWVAVVASAACLVFSLYRTGMFVLLVSVALWVLVAGEREAFGRRTLATSVAVGSALYVLTSDIGSTGSLQERWARWGALLTSHDVSPLGRGLGFAGAASSSRFSVGYVTVDNQYLSHLLQLGILAAVVTGPLVVLAVWMVRRARREPPLRVGVVLAACLVAFVFVEFWEYTAAMTMVLVAVSYALAAVAPPGELRSRTIESSGQAIQPAAALRCRLVPPGSVTPSGRLASTELGDQSCDM